MIEECSPIKSPAQSLKVSLKNYTLTKMTPKLSFCIGVQKTANDTHIQILGRHKSDAYKLYFQTPSQELANLSKVLVAGPKNIM